MVGIPLKVFEEVAHDADEIVMNVEKPSDLAEDSFLNKDTDGVTFGQLQHCVKLLSI